MIRSMTGYGRAQLRTKYGTFIAEIRTVNHKFLETSFKLPNSFSIFDDKVKELIRKKISRGKVYLNLSQETCDYVADQIYIDEGLAKNYYEKLARLKRKLGIEGKIQISDIISFPGVINYKLQSRNIDRLWSSIRQVVEKALDRLIKEREKEGRYLLGDIDRRMRKIKKTILNIKKRTGKNVENYKRNLQERIKKISGECPVDKGRIEMEVALYAKQSDISEEVTRLKNHIINFNYVSSRTNREAGKKLDFIAQELHREITTIGSKSNDYIISKGVIEIKSEIEKVREQLKNIE